MKKTVSLAFVLALILPLAASCAFQFPNSTPTPEPELVYEGNIELGYLYYADDFSNPDSGWKTQSTDSGSTIAYEHDGLHFVVNDILYDYWSRYPRVVGDVRIRVDASKLGGPDDNVFGVMCRYQDTDHYYSFLISSDGYYGVFKKLDNQLILLGGATSMQFSSLINQGIATNTIVASCNGMTLKLYVNGVEIFEAIDNEYDKGEIGLIAGAQSLPGVDILFDNFAMYTPAP